jgi:hypothetical protein
MEVVRQHYNGVDRERMSMPRIPKRRAQRLDVLNEPPPPTFGQVHREEITPARHKITPIARHRTITSLHDGFRSAQPILHVSMSPKGKRSMAASGSALLYRRPIDPI